MKSVLFQKGTLVEVGSDDESFKDVWYIATIIETPSTDNPTSASSKNNKNHKINSNNPDTDKYLIEYTSLFDCDGSTPMREHVKPEFVRPLSPMPSEAGDLAHSFSLYEVVDAFYSDGWWTGVITRIIDDDTVDVAFECPPDVIAFRISELRSHRSWIDGKWVRPENQRSISKSMFGVGIKLEVCFDKDDYGDVCFPPTVLEDLGNESFMAECQTIGGNNSNSDGMCVKGTADLQHIRPSPIHLNEQMEFELLEIVDAFYKFYSWNGVTTPALAAVTMDIVYFQHKDKEMEFHHPDLKPKVEWDDGKWTASSPENIIESNSQEEQIRAHCISANDSNKMAVDHATSGARKGNSACCSLDYGENQSFKSTRCNGNPSSYGMTSVRKITKPKTPAGIDSASQSWCSKKIHGDAPNVPSLNMCELNSAVMEVPCEEIFISFSSPPMASAEARCLQQSVDSGDLLKPKIQSHSSTKDPSQLRNDTSVMRKRGRPRKSPQLRDAGYVLVTGSGSIDSGDQSKPKTRSHALTNDADQLRNDTSVTRKRGRPRKSPQLGDADHVLVTGSGSVDSGDQSKPKTQSHSSTKDLAQLRNNTSVMRKRGRPRKSPQLRDADHMLVTGSGSVDIKDPAQLRNDTSVKRKRGRPRKSSQLGDADHVLVIAPGSLVSVENFKPKTQSHSSTEDPDQLRNDTSVTRKRGRPQKSPQLGDAGHVLVIGSDSKERSNGPMGSKRATGKTIKKLPEKRLKLSTGKKTRTSNRGENNDGSIDEAGGVVPDPNRSLAFEKTSHLWQMIDCMEVFQLMPQNPHFGPLNSCSESCREGLAIGCMITFSNVAKKISELRFDDPRSIEENLENVRELASQGFDVKMLHDRLNELLLIKDKHELLQAQIAERAAAEKTQTDDDGIDEIDKQIRELQEKHALAMSKKKLQDSEMAFLKSSKEYAEEGMRSSRDDFEKLATAPWVGDEWHARALI